ncbi:putative glycine-rich autotransporter protein, partial [Candidatus Regiella insecticola 5.15]
MILGNDTALGSGEVKLEKKVSLNSTIPLKLANTVWINEDLNVVGDHDLTLDGVISGPGSLSKFGMNHLMLNAANNYSGGTFFDDGIILLSNDT